MFDFDVNAPLETISPLTFAYVGDAVHELYVRTMLAKDKNLPASKLHRAATTFVSARAQSQTVAAIEEKSERGRNKKIFLNRGRNAKSPTSAKNADILDYRRATGFETLLGYLYFKKRFLHDWRKF
ncbi:MAG: ribonuclease III [Clostridiales bacterium]|nr:MAG: ribonuclease III [Clostridiales bacterium]